MARPQPDLILPDSLRAGYPWCRASSQPQKIRFAPDSTLEEAVRRAMSRKRGVRDESSAPHLGTAERKPAPTSFGWVSVQSDLAPERSPQPYLLISQLEFR